MARHNDDEFTSGWESGDIPGTVESASYVDAPNHVHEQFWNIVRDMIREEVMAMSPRLGTVLQNSTAGVVIQADDEDESRTIPLARKTGNRYKSGDRVVIHKMRSGEEFVGGVISSKADGQLTGGRVGRPDLEDQAVGRDQLDTKAVGSSELDNSVVALGHLTPTLQNLINSKLDASDLNVHPSGSVVGPGNRILTENSVSVALQGSGTSGRLATKAQVDTAKSAADTAQARADDAFTKAGDASTKASEAKSSVAEIDSAALKIRRGLKAGFITLQEADDRYKRL